MKKKASKNITPVDEKINIDNIGLVQETLNIAGVAGWELYTHSGKLLWTDNAADILADKKNSLNTTADLTAYFNKDSAVLLSGALNGANENGIPFHLHLTQENLPFKRFIIRCNPKKSLQKNDILRGSIQDISLSAFNQNFTGQLDDKYHSLIENSANANFLANLDGDILDANHTAVAMFGYTVEELKKLNRTDLIDFNQPGIAELQNKRDLNGHVSGELTGIHKNGLRFDCEFSSAGFTDSNGEKRISTILKNISSSKNAEKALKESKDTLQKAFDITSMGSWKYDYLKNLFYWSKSALDVLGIDETTALLTIEQYKILIHPDDLQLYVTEIESSSTKGVFNLEYRICINESIKWIKVKSHREFDSKGEAIAAVGIIQDITARKLNEIAVETLNEELLQSNKELEHFAYIASHDLQEPLRMVSSFLGLLESKYKTQLDDTAKQYIEYAVDGANRMRILIAELLDYSRTGANQDPFIDIDVNVCLKNILEFFAAHLQQTQAKINIHPMAVIKGSAIQITQLLQNIIGNALKYNHSAVPEIEIGLKEKKDHWQFFVKDNGIGIDAQYFEKIFIIFQRLHNRKDFSGTGIGLAICKKIVDRHGGKIWVKSTENEGSTFFFTIKK